MDPAVLLVLAAAAVAVVAAFALRARAPGWLVAAILAAAGAGLAWGGMLLRPRPSTGEVLLAVTLLAVLLPAHVRIVLGPLGRGPARPRPEDHHTR